jgi:hypothetical protein
MAQFRHFSDTEVQPIRDHNVRRADILHRCEFGFSGSHKKKRAICAPLYNRNLWPDEELSLNPEPALVRVAFLPGLLNTAIRFVILSAAKNPLGCHVNPRCHPELHLPHWSNLPQLSPRAKRSGVEGNAVAFAFRFPDFPIPRFPDLPDLPTPRWPD